MLRRKVWILFLVCAFIVTAVNVFAEEKKPVKMIGTAILSGKLGAIKETGWGLMDGAAYINSQGGINGRKFELILEDGQYEVPLSVSIFNRVVAAEPKDELIFHSGWQTGVLHSISEKVNENHVVCTDGSMSTDIFTEQVKEKHPYFFSCGVTYGDQTGALFKFIKENLNKGKDKPKIAFIYIDAPAGNDPLEKMKAYAKSLDIDLVLVEPVTFTTTDYTPTLMKIRKSKADYIVLWSWSVPVTTRFIKMARKVLPKAEILTMSYGAWEIFFATTGEDFDGVYALSPYPRPNETDNPLVALMWETAKKEGHSEIKIWDLYFSGFLMSMINAEAAARADKAGKLTREGVRDVLENLTDWDLFGMYEGKTLDYSKHRLSRARILKADFKSKSLLPVTEWFDMEEYLK